MGFPYFGWLVSIFSVVIRTALTYKIPLIFYGENGEVEYGGNFEKDKLFLDPQDLERIFLEGGYKKVLKLSKLSEKELYWFKLPKSFKRILSCHPIKFLGGGEGFDPVIKRTKIKK